MKFEGKVAIVTGASRGLGKASSIAFAKEGASVVAVARTEKEGESRLPGTLIQTAEAIQALGGRVLVAKTDISQEQEVEELVRKTLSEFGRIDILVNNAAANFYANIWEFPVKRWDLVINVNLRGTFLCTKAVLPTMMEQKSGSIINITAVHARRTGYPHGTAYGASKVAIDAFSQAVAAEVKDYNIAVNSLSPTRGLDTEGAKFLNLDPSRLDPPEMVAKAILYLAAQDASTLTGQFLVEEELRDKY